MTTEKCHSVCLLVHDIIFFSPKNKPWGAKVCVQYAAGNCNGTVSETTESELGGRVGIGNACGNKGECGTQDAGEHQQ